MNNMNLNEKDEILFDNSKVMGEGSRCWLSCCPVVGYITVCAFGNIPSKISPTNHECFFFS